MRLDISYCNPRRILLFCRGDDILDHQNQNHDDENKFTKKIINYLTKKVVYIKIFPYLCIDIEF